MQAHSSNYLKMEDEISLEYLRFLVQLEGIQLKKNLTVSWFPRKGDQTFKNILVDTFQESFRS